MAQPADDQLHPHPWRAFIVLAIPIFLTILDLFIVNVALPAVAFEFPGASLSELSWVLTAYAIVFVAVLVPAGKLGDLYGGVVGCTSAASSCSWSGPRSRLPRHRCRCSSPRAPSRLSAAPRSRRILWA
jgi:hypothetical protein